MTLFPGRAQFTKQRSHPTKNQIMASKETPKEYLRRSLFSHALCENEYASASSKNAARLDFNKTVHSSRPRVQYDCTVNIITIINYNNYI